MTKNEASCLTKQTEMSCDSNRQNACMTVSYKTKRDGEYITRFKKGCWESYSHCQDFCSLTTLADKKDCEVNVMPYFDLSLGFSLF